MRRPRGRGSFRHRQQTNYRVDKEDLIDQAKVKELANFAIVSRENAMMSDWFVPPIVIPAAFVLVIVALAFYRIFVGA